VGGSESSTGGKGGAAAAGAPSNEEGGSAGAADGAGSAGEGAGQGEGGGGSTPTSGECASALTARVQYRLLRSDSIIQFQLRFSNEGAVPLALGQYEFDYYFSNEEDSQWNAYVDDASTNGGTDGYVALIGVTEVEPMPLSPPPAAPRLSSSSSASAAHASRSSRSSSRMPWTS
jgi:hypothetical protein